MHGIDAGRWPGCLAKPLPVFTERISLVGG
jgi:hypothetical protein